MPTPEEIYVNGVKRHFRHYFAAWPPNESYQLGDIGVLDGNLFVRIKNLASPDIGIGFETRGPESPAMIDLVSDAGVSLVFKGAGEANQLALPNIPQAEVGIGVEFSKEGAFILKAPSASTISVSDIEKLGRDILGAYIEGRWNLRWVVVVRVVQASTATILVSRSSRSKLELLVSGDVNAGPIDLVNANLAFSVRAQSGDLFQSIGAKNVTPIFQVARIRKSLWGTTEVEIAAKSQGRRLLPTDLLTPQGAQSDTSLQFDLLLDEGLHDLK
jgi:hypothetical protein